MSLARITAGIALCAALLVPAALRAQTGPAAKAAQLNDEGKSLFGEERYLAAAKKFEQAIILSPAPKYYFNLCFTLNYLERYAEALEQCRAVRSNGGDAKLQGKADKLIVELEKRVPSAPPPNNGDPNNPNNGDPNNPNNGDPNNPNNPNNGDPNNPNNGDPNNPNNPNNGDPNNQVNPGNPGPGPIPAGPANPFVQEEAPSTGYRWSLGGELGGLANLGMGSSEFGDVYSGGGFHLRIFGNFILSEARQFGVQPYFGYTNIEGAEGIGGIGGLMPDPLRMFDFGGALFLHRKINDRITYTPLVGLHVSVQSVEDDVEDAFVALGARAEVQFAYLLGSQGQHALTITPGLNLYGASTESTDSVFSPADFGLDQPGATMSFSFGYSLRFATPFGSNPLISLE